MNHLMAIEVDLAKFGLVLAGIDTSRYNEGQALELLEFAVQSIGA